MYGVIVHTYCTYVCVGQLMVILTPEMRASLY